MRRPAWVDAHLKRIITRYLKRLYFREHAYRKVASDTRKNFAEHRRIADPVRLFTAGGREAHVGRRVEETKVLA
jgi:hypothetical protein